MATPDPLLDNWLRDQGFKVAPDCYLAARVAFHAHDVELNEAHARADLLAQGLWDAWAALGFDTDGDSGPQAVIAGMGVQGFIESMMRDIRQFRADYDALQDQLQVVQEEAE